MRGWSCVALVVSVWGSVAVADPSSSALDKPAFTAAPAELLAVARTAPGADESITMLRSEREVSFDDSGRATVRTRWIYVVRGEAGLDEWSEAYAAWRPSFHDRPVIRARVITPQGTAVALDPAQLSEPTIQQGTQGAGSDRRTLRGTLPPLEVGAVVEYETATTDREPVPGGGGDLAAVEDLWAVGEEATAASVVVTYSAPVASKARHIERKLPSGTRTQHRVAQGREIWVHELGPLGEHGGFESSAPSDVTTPCVGITLAASWASVARALRAAIDQRIAAEPFALPPELPRLGAVDAVHAIVAWLDRKVRPDWRFGEPLGIPQSPAATVRYGEAAPLDRAVLLVALLRQAGVRADVALVRLGWRDVDPDLPGIAAFNHALVRARVAGRELWIEAGAVLTRPGQLSDGVQGRRVLVLADGTRGLTTTPAAASGDNAIRDVRTFRPADHGNGRLTRMVRYAGVFESEQRASIHGTPRDVVKQRLAHTIANRFGGSLERVASTLVDDPRTPFEMTLEVTNTRRVFTRMQQIDAYLPLEDAFENLPWELEGDRARVHDFVWPRPHVHEIESRIVVPQGYTLPTPAPERKRALGTATLVERQRIEGRTVIVSFRFDTGKRRVTPAELAALQAAVRDVRKESVVLKIELTANALVEAGKLREGVSEGERLVALHPTEWLRHCQLAMVLLRAGAGEAARREARKAVAMAPRNARALSHLGWILSFDTLGRQYAYDWDRAGAIEVLQRARELDPEHVGTLETLAEVLERDAQGRRLGAGADLEEAADVLRAAITRAKTDSRMLWLAEILLRSGKFALTEQLARSVADSDSRNLWLVAAVAAQAGAAQAIQEAGTLRSGDARNRLLAMAGYQMMILGRYPVALALYDEVGTLGKGSPEAAAAMRKIARQPDLAPATGDPRTAVLDAIAALADRRRTTRAFWDEELEAAVRDVASKYMPSILPGAPTPRVLADVLQSATTIAIEGDAGAWRATVESEGRRWQMYVVLDGAIAKLVGATDRYEAVGRYALRAGDAAARARARRLLDWIRADADKSTAPEVVSFRRVWGPGLPATPDALALAAALLSDGSDADRAIAVATRCPSTVPGVALACHEVLLSSYLARERWADAVARYDAILAQHPDRAASYARGRAWSLAAAGRVDDADRILDDVLAGDPDHRDAFYARYLVAANFRPLRDGLVRADAIASWPKATANQLNDVAWFRFTTGSDLPRALELARKALRGRAASHIANTVAVLEAELGELDHALVSCRRSMELQGVRDPGDGDWYVMGRIYEQLDLASDAVAAYKRIAKPDRSPRSLYALAQKRLAALHAP